jgi:hypothetical protein
VHHDAAQSRIENGAGAQQTYRTKSGPYLVPAGIDLVAQIGRDQLQTLARSQAVGKRLAGVRARNKALRTQIVRDDADRHPQRAIDPKGRGANEGSQQQSADSDEYRFEEIKHRSCS